VSAGAAFAARGYGFMPLSIHCLNKAVEKLGCFAYFDLLSRQDVHVEHLQYPCVRVLRKFGSAESRIRALRSS
jgi:hypothetical protein